MTVPVSLRTLLRRPTGITASPAGPEGPEAQEFAYLRPLLESLPAPERVALDVGAHAGGVTRLLAGMGFRVLALEPNPDLRRGLVEGMGPLLASGQVRVLEAAASDRDGEADLYLASADTLSSLEASWTSVAFPEYFPQRRTIRVATRRLSRLLEEQGVDRVGFVKIDTEGHEASVLRGLFDAPGLAERPAVLMFEANQRFAGKAEECLSFLRSHGYGPFDVFIKDGSRMLAAVRCAGDQLPPEWRPYGRKYFYANIIAYSSATIAAGLLPALDSMCEREQRERARALLARSLRAERGRSAVVHREWRSARADLRRYLLKDDFRSFLESSECRGRFFRTGWTSAQDHESRLVSSTNWGRRLLEEFREPPVGRPEMSPRLANLSTNMLGMMYYLARLRTFHEEVLPRRVIEVGGGYGAFCYLYCRERADAAYVIVDLPEMLALQHYYLSLCLPERDIRLCLSQDDVLRKGADIILVPVSFAMGCGLRGDLFFSTFALSEMPAALQAGFAREDFFECGSALLAGRLAADGRGGGGPHSALIGAMVQRFRQVRIERFHIGENYLLEARR